MRILIYILAGTIIGSFIYFFFIDNFFNKNNYSQMEVVNDLADKDDDDEEVNRLVMYNKKISIKLTSDEIDASGITYKKLTKKKINIQVSKSALSVDSKNLYNLVEQFDLLNLNLYKEKINKTYLNKNYNRLKDLYENQGSIALKDLEKSKFLKITSESEINIFNQKIKNVKNKIKNFYGIYLLKDILGERLIYNKLKDNNGALIIVEDIDINKINDNYFYDNKNLIFLTLYNNATFFIGNVGLFYLDEVFLSANRKLSIINNSKDHIEGYYIPDNALLYHNGKIWAYFLEKDLIFSRYEISNFQKATNNAIFINSKLINLNVVTSGSHVLLAEEFRSQIMREDDD